MSEQRRKELHITTNKKTHIYAFNIKNGDIIWNTSDNEFGTWLSYSKEYNILMKIFIRLKNKNHVLKLGLLF